MSGQSWIILSPAPERAGIRSRPHVDTSRIRRAALADLNVGLLSNSKANVNHLFRGLATTLGDQSIKSITLFDKGSATIPAPADMLADIAANVDVLVTGMAD
jgi:hypothetical protein